MSQRALAQFLHTLLRGEVIASAPINHAPTLAQLVTHPPHPFERLLQEHVGQFLNELPGHTRPTIQTIPSLSLWVAAALNNLCWAQQHPDPRLLTITLRLVQALPSANQHDTAIAYHSILRFLHHLSPDPAWQPVVRALQQSNPLTAALWPHCDTHFQWPLFLDMMRIHAYQCLFRDRFLSLSCALRDDEQLSLDSHVAQAHAHHGRLMSGILEHGGQDYYGLLLALYEADCALLRHGDMHHPTWPMLPHLGASRGSNDPLVRRNANRILRRYHALISLSATPALLHPYHALDARFIEQLATVMPSPRLPLRIATQI